MSELTPEQLAGLAKLRTPFEANQISKLPKPTKKQTEDVKANYTNGFRCPECGTWHHRDVVHLDYVGHAALTNRLLDVDPLWTWEPMALNEQNLPRTDKVDGMWIKLTVCGVTRLGYGDAQGKSGPNAVKEIIGDALRNAAMRFGAALDLWHKGILHMDVADDVEQVVKTPIAGKAFEKALKSVTAGDYSVSEIELTYTLTEDQRTALSDAENEAKK